VLSAKPDSLIRDEVRAELANYFHSAERDLFDLACEHAALLVELAAAVRDGVGVGMLPCFIGDADPELVRLGDPLAELTAGLWILIHPDLRRNARVRAFVDYATEHLGAARDRLAGGA